MIGSSRLTLPVCTKAGQRLLDRSAMLASASPPNLKMSGEDWHTTGRDSSKYQATVTASTIVSRNASASTSNRLCSGAVTNVLVERGLRETVRRTVVRRSSRALAIGSIMFDTPHGGLVVWASRPVERPA